MFVGFCFAPALCEPPDAFHTLVRAKIKNRIWGNWSRKKAGYDSAPNSYRAFSSPESAPEVIASPSVHDVKKPPKNCALKPYNGSCPHCPFA